MYILNAAQIKEWDEYTIQYEPVASIDLMERAAAKCVKWIVQQPWQNKQFKIFCGKGNNGGDGLAIARLLAKANYTVSVYILELGKAGSKDFEINLIRLNQPVSFLHSSGDFPVIEDDIVIDALFGLGLNKPLEQLAANLVLHLNKATAPVVSIDLPSGLFADQSSKNNVVIEATHTVSFQCYKPAFVVQENALFIGKIHLADIGLHPGFLEENKFTQHLVEATIIRQIFKHRNVFAHKGTHGHALIIGGSYGKIGAAILAAKACLHSGAGLTTAFIPKCGYLIMQMAVPEVMVLTDEEQNILSSLPQDIEKYTAIGLGPGMGTDDRTQKLISFLVRRYRKPLVIDADGLNCLALHRELLQQLSSDAILTPHPKEFDRLFGEHQTDFARIKTAQEKATEFNCIIVLKSHHTLIATPGGQTYYNSTGNAGMAKGGSGDVLTGMITAFLAQGYDPVHAAILGVYLHGFAGDLAAGVLSQEAMTATDIIHFFSQAFLKL